MREVVNVENLREKFVCSNPVELDIKRIHPFKKHPFKVIDDDSMKELIESISKQGVLSPVLVRQAPNGTFEMISGHRRLHAAEKVGLKSIPGIVISDLTDNEAIIIMVDSNLHRDQILPSERAFSLKMKMDALRHQGVCRHIDNSLSVADRKSAAIVGKESGLAARSVHRYICLTALLPELLDMVDRKELSLVNGVEISHFAKEVQEYILGYIKKNGKIETSQIEALKKLANPENLTPYTAMTIMKQAAGNKPVSKRLDLTSRKMNSIFPEEYSIAKREKIIMELLTKWKEENNPEDITGRAEG